MHYYNRNIGDYHKKAGRLSMLEHGAYTLLLDACYDRERFPTIDDAIEWTWARTDEEIAAVRFVISKFFVLVDGFFEQTHIKEELDKYQSNCLINKRIAIEREEKRRNKLNVNSTNRVRTVNEAPPNQEPITNNQEPITINYKPIKNIKGSRLSNDWIAPQEFIDFCEKERPDLNANDIAEIFKDFWIGVAGSKGVKSDWIATWRNWVRRQPIGKSKFKNKSSIISDTQFEYWLNGETKNARIG